MSEALTLRELVMVHIRQTLAAVAAVVLVGLAGCSASPNSSAPNNAPYNGSHNYPQPYPTPLDPNGRPIVGREVDTATQTQSTFAIDVDTASYNLARRQILDGSRPDPDTVRPEEFVNAFRQDYQQPTADGFTVDVDGSRPPATHRFSSEGDYRLMRVGLQTRAEDPSQRQDAALTFVVDVSGSMAEPGRLDLVQDALHTLVDQLRPTDSVALVAFNERAQVLRPMTPVRNKSALHDAIDRLAAGGSTNLEDGLVTGYRVAREGFVAGASNRVILTSDGLANVGDTQANPILDQIREEAAKQITLLGVGVGSEYGDALMEQLADSGDGFVTYISDRDQARQLFVTKLPATLAVRARDAKVQVTFNQSTVASFRLIGYEDRALNASDFHNNRVDGGEVGPGHSVTALYMVRLQNGARGQVAQARVHWLDPTTREDREQATAVDVSDLGGDFAGASTRMKVDYAAAWFAEVLRHSPYAGEVRLADLATIASGVAIQSDDDQVSELSTLIRRADGSR